MDQTPNFVTSADMIAINRVLRALTQMRQASDISLEAYSGEDEIPLNLFDSNGETVGRVAWEHQVNEYVFQTAGVER